jgi:tetratricopeptide (TPR) repeat protein
MEQQSEINNVSSHLEAADLHIKAGNLEKAIECYQNALSLEPENADIYNALGLVMLHLGQNDMAKELFITASALAPKSSQSFRNLGLVYYALNNRKAAVESFEKALKIDPGNGDALLNLGQIYKNEDKQQLARGYFERAVVAKKLDPIPLAELAELLTENQEYAQAAEVAKAALTLDPSNIQAIKSISKSYRYIGNLSEAIHWGKKLIELEPGFSSSFTHLAKAYIEYGEHRIGSEYAKKAILLDPKDASGYACYASGIARSGNWDNALENINKALELSPNNERYIAQKAGFLILKGKYKDAFTLIKPLVHGRSNINTDSLQMYLNLAPKFGEEEQAGVLADEVLLNKNIPENVRLGLSFAAGNLYDRLHKYEKAFEYYETANSLKHLKYNPEEQERKVNNLISEFSQEFFKRLPHTSHQSKRPIFIVGMPRSGTSLTEKILASHSQVFGADELTEIREICVDMPIIIGKNDAVYPQCIHDLTQESLDKAALRYLDFIDELDTETHAHITDKMPQNFNHIGIIAAMFPDSPIIHCKRNALDTCLSCYFQNFGAAGLEFTYNLEDLGHYYRLYERVMNHWHSVLPNRIYDLSYDDLVSNPDEEIRKLVDYCGLQWEDSCLSHHKSRHVSKTASFDQVRQPIYTKSSERWRNYEKHLAPLKETLEIQ